jgi:hypothetical protein
MEDGMGWVGSFNRRDVRVMIIGLVWMIFIILWVVF